MESSGKYFNHTLQLVQIRFLECYYSAQQLVEFARVWRGKSETWSKEF